MSGEVVDWVASAKGWGAAVVELMMRREKGRGGRAGVQGEKFVSISHDTPVGGGRCKKRCTSGRVCHAEKDWAWAVEKHDERMETQPLQRGQTTEMSEKENGSLAGMERVRGGRAVESVRWSGMGRRGGLFRRVVPTRYLQATDTGRRSQDFRSQMGLDEGCCV